MSELRPTLGAVLVGGVVGAFLSGIVTMQAVLYYRFYATDRPIFKCAVGVIWALDLLHTSMALAANWTYLIQNFGNDTVSDYITWMIAGTVTLTALITFFVHIFFSHRIHTLSHANWRITSPIISLALARLVLALVSTSKMIQLKSYHDFVQRFSFVFTAGLSCAAAVDILIACALIWYLNQSRTGFSSMDAIIDSITLYTIESGLLTGVTTVVSLICWVSMPHNLVFLGLHFVISKLYANAFLATLNARKVLRGRTQGSSDLNEHPLPILFADNLRVPNRASRELYITRGDAAGPTKTQVHVNIEKMTSREEDEDRLVVEHVSERSYPPSEAVL